MKIDDLVISEPILNGDKENVSKRILRSPIANFYDINKRKFRQFKQHYESERDADGNKKNNGKNRKPIPNGTINFDVFCQCGAYTNSYVVKSFDKDGNILNTNYH